MHRRTGSQDKYFKFKEVSVGDVLTCLNAVDPHKAVGSHQVPGVLLKSCSTVLAGPLAQIVNASLAAGYVPRAFRLSYISPLFTLNVIFWLQKHRQILAMFL